MELLPTVSRGGEGDLKSASSMSYSKKYFSCSSRARASQIRAILKIASLVGDMVVELGGSTHLFYQFLSVRARTAFDDSRSGFLGHGGCTHGIYERVREFYSKNFVHGAHPSECITPRPDVILFE